MVRLHLKAQGSTGARRRRGPLAQRHDARHFIRQAASSGSGA